MSAGHLETEEALLEGLVGATKELYAMYKAREVDWVLVRQVGTLISEYTVWRLERLEGEKRASRN